VINWSTFRKVFGAIGLTARSSREQKILVFLIASMRHMPITFISTCSILCTFYLINYAREKCVVSLIFSISGSVNHWALIRRYITRLQCFNPTTSSATKFIQFGNSHVGGKGPLNNQTGYFRCRHNDTRGK
jgi:hypothetical protein